MRLTLSDIDPILAQRIREKEETLGPRFAASPNQTVSNPLEEIIRTRALAHRGLQGIAGCLAGSLTLFGTIILLQSANTSGAGPVMIFLLSVGLLLAGVMMVDRHYRRRILRNTEPTLVERGVSVVASGRLEKIYAELTEELRKAEGAGEASAREVLKQMNVLLDGHRVLDQHRIENQKAMNSRSVEGLESELRDLKKRAATSTDPQTREALEQSVVLCAQRVESIRALSTAQERIIAQQEVIYQTLTSVHAAFARQRTAPFVDVAALPRVADISETVADIQRRTRAVEQAVEELAVLRRTD